MRTRIGKVPDRLISLSLLLIFLILTGVSVAKRAQADLHVEARAPGCFDDTTNMPTMAKTDELRARARKDEPKRMSQKE